MEGRRIRLKAAAATTLALTGGYLLMGTASFSWDLTALRPGMKFYAAPTNPERTRRSDATLSK